MSSPGRFLQRWSRLKRNEAAGERPPQAELAPVPATQGGRTDPEARPAPVATVDPAVALPAVESLDPSSDFTAFLKEEVSESLRRAALKKLFGDPVFNAMDGLDIYIDDYSIPDPIAPDVMQRLKQFETFLAEPGLDADTDERANETCSGTAASPRSGADGSTSGAMQHDVSVALDDPGEQAAPGAASDTLSVEGQNVPAAPEAAGDRR